MMQLRAEFGNRTVFFPFLVLVVVLMQWSCTSKDKPVQYRKTVEGAVITVTVKKGNFIVGKNEAAITLLNAEGKMIKSENIQVRFFTPHVKGQMGHDSFPTVVQRDGEAQFAVEFPRSGEWRMEVNFMGTDWKTPQIATDYIINVRPR